MTDPMDGLNSFQPALLNGIIDLHQCVTDKDLYMHLDFPTGDKSDPRYTYVRLNGQTVKAIVMISVAPPMEGKICFGIGYAVPEAFRGQGLAKDIVTAALKELRYGFTNAGVREFFIEAIVAADNDASNAVALATLSTERKATTDKLSGTPSFQYVKNSNDIE